MYGKVPALIPLAMLILLSGCVSKVIYFPEARVRYTPEHLKLSYEDITFQAKDGTKLSGWWVPAPGSKVTVLYCHGNGGNISSYLDAVVVCSRLGLNVCMFDYRGYGTSSGSPSEQGTYLDADSAWDYLVTERKIAPETIIIWGRSLGGAIAARTASMHPSGLVIIESSFISLKCLAHDLTGWVPGWMLANYSYDTRSYLAKVSAPVLVIHSPDDEVIPFRHGTELFDAVRTEKDFLRIRGTHNQGFVHSLDVYEHSIKAFIDRHLKEG